MAKAYGVTANQPAYAQAGRCGDNKCKQHFAKIRLICCTVFEAKFSIEQSHT
jgi:hypothetical protein